MLEFGVLTFSKKVMNEDDEGVVAENLDLGRLEPVVPRVQVASRLRDREPLAVLALEATQLPVHAEHPVEWVVPSSL
jgi:hypothetical protein